MAENLINAGLAQKIAELRRADALERERRLGAAEAAVPPYEDLIQLGPAPEEYTPVPRLGPPGPGGMGPREMMQPEYWGNPWSSPESPGRASDVPAVEDARLRYIGAMAGSAPHKWPNAAFEDWFAANKQATGYRYPFIPAMREQERLLEEARAQEAARQMALEQMLRASSTRDLGGRSPV